MLGCGIIFDSVSHSENHHSVPHVSCKDVVFTRECMQNDVLKDALECKELLHCFYS